MLSNQLEVFKDRDPRMSAYAGKHKIFFNEDCRGGRHSYDAQAINDVFINNFNPDNLLARFIIMMHVLQKGYHEGVYPAALEAYIGAHEEFPERYEDLVAGLNEEALDIIAHYDISGYTAQLPSNLGRTFVETLHMDKKAFAYESAPQTTALALTKD